MSEGVDVTGISAGQLAQARGCYPENDCHRDCVDNAQWTLDHVDGLDGDERERLVDHVAWVRAQEWL